MGERLSEAQLDELAKVVVGDAHIAPIHWVFVSRMIDEIRERRAVAAMRNAGTYIASRASLPERSAAWRRLRDIDGWKITSSWIDEAGTGETTDLRALWVRIENEIARSERLVLYVEPGDFPLKGALIEAGIAIAHLIPIRVVAPGVVLEPVSFRPIGSWVRHPLVTFADTMEEALAGATVNM